MSTKLVSAMVLGFATCIPTAVRAAVTLSVDLDVGTAGTQSERTVEQGEEFQIQLVISNVGEGPVLFDEVVLEVFMNDMGDDVLTFSVPISLPTAGDLANLAPSLDAVTGRPVVEGDKLQLEFPPAKNPPFTLASGRGGLRAARAAYLLEPNEARVVALGKAAGGILPQSVGMSTILADNVVEPPVSLEDVPVEAVTVGGIVTVIVAHCEGDANADGIVDPLDSGYVLSRLGCAVGAGDPECDAADVNEDAVVDPLDVGYVLSRFGACP